MMNTSVKIAPTYRKADSTPSLNIPPNLTESRPATYTSFMLVAWLVVAITIRVSLGPVWGTAIIGAMGVLGVVAFCDWYKAGEATEFK